MPDDLYSRDILAWSVAQAERLRRMQAGERVNDLDWANVIEEIEEVGRSEVKAVESLLLQALTHALKIVAWPESEAARHWRSEIRAFLVGARRRFSPSMAQQIDVAEIFADAREIALDQPIAQPPRPLPETTDLTLGELLTRGFGADALVVRLAPRGDDHA